MDFPIEFLVSQDLSIYGLISTLKGALRTEFRVYPIDIDIQGVEPQITSGQRFIAARLIRMKVKIPLTIDDSKIFYNFIEEFIKTNDDVAILTRW